MLSLLLVEDSGRLRQALKTGLEAEGKVRVIHGCASGEAALAHCLIETPDVILMDLIKAFYPDLLPEHEFVYYQALQ